MDNQNPEQKYSIPSTTIENNVPAIKPGELPGQVTPSIPPSIQPSAPNVVLPTIDIHTPIAQIENSTPETSSKEATKLEKTYLAAKNLGGGNAFALMNEINKDIFGATSDK